MLGDFRSRSRVCKAAGSVGVLAAVVFSLGAGRDGSAAGPAAGQNVVSIDVADAYVSVTGIAYWVVTEQAVQIPLALAEPATVDGGVSVGTVSSLTPGLGTVFFEPQTTSANTTRSFPTGPGTPFYPGWSHHWGYFALTETSPGLERGTPWDLRIVRVTEIPTAVAGEICPVPWFEALLCALRVYPDCPPSASARAGSAPFGGIDVLQRYRDEVLAPTEDGQYYIALLDQIGLDVCRAVVRSPAFAARILNARGAWLLGLEALVDGNGASVVITQQMEDDLLGLLQTFEAVGSPQLASSLAFERTRLQLDTLAGTTMTSFQNQVESLGGPTAVEPWSWGSVKELYRAPRR